MMLFALQAVTAAPSFGQSAVDPVPAFQWGAFLDIAYLGDPNVPANHLFRNRGTTPRVNAIAVNMAASWVRKAVSDSSRWGIELTAHGGEDSKTFGFSSTAPNVRGAEVLSHLGPTDVQYLAPVGKGLTIQAGIFSSVIGYDSLYAKDNLTYTRPWGADYTPYLMLGVNASYPFAPRLTGIVVAVSGYFHLAHANDVPSLGGQLAYRATDRTTLKQSVLAGPHQSNTTFDFWRVLSDTIVERRAARLVMAFEYQLGVERVVDAIGRPRALWMSAQWPVQWIVRPSWRLTARPELAWDRDGRWISGHLGSGQSIAGFTSTVEYRISYPRGDTMIRLEHRFDDSRGPDGGFFEHQTQVTPRQQLLIVACIVTIDSAIHR